MTPDKIPADHNIDHAIDTGEAIDPVLEKKAREKVYRLDRSYDYAGEIARLRAERDEARAEALEEARLNAMGSEREARLRAEIERLRGLLQGTLSWPNPTPSTDPLPPYSPPWGDAMTDPVCCICDSTDDLRTAPLMTGDKLGAPPKYPVCGECIMLWYDSGETERDKLRAMRLEARDA